MDRDRRSEGERGCARVNGDLCVTLMSDSRHSPRCTVRVDQIFLCPYGRALRKDGRTVLSTAAAAMRSAARWAVVVICLALAACGNSPSFDELNSDLEKLAVPDAWRLAASETVGRGGDVECDPVVGSPFCPKVIRYYVTTGTPREAYEQAAQMVVDAGFVFESTELDPCDRLPSSSECTAVAVANDRRLAIQVWPPDADLSALKIEDATGPIVSVTVWRNVTK